MKKKKNEVSEPQSPRRPTLPRKVRATPKLDELKQETKPTLQPEEKAAGALPLAEPTAPMPLEQAWQQLVQEHQEDQQLCYLLSKPYEVQQDVIRLTVESRTLLALVEEQKPRWRKRLMELTGKLYAIEVRLEVKEIAVDDAESLHSTQGKLRYLLKEYPHLKQIWEHLKLTPNSHT